MGVEPGGDDAGERPGFRRDEETAAGDLRQPVRVGCRPPSLVYPLRFNSNLSFNCPNPRTYEGEQNRVVKLPPGKTITYDLQLTVHGDEAGVSESEKAIAALQAGVEPKVYDKPQKGWCADA